MDVFGGTALRWKSIDFDWLPFNVTCFVGSIRNPAVSAAVNLNVCFTVPALETRTLTDVSSLYTRVSVKTKTQKTCVINYYLSVFINSK